MLKIKLFRFRVNNRTCSDMDDDKYTSWYNREKLELYSLEDIENIVNDFLSKHNVLKIDSCIITCRVNEDKSRDNNVDLLYTIVYDEPITHFSSESNVYLNNNECELSYSLNKCEIEKENLVINDKERRVRQNSSYYDN